MKRSDWRDGLLVGTALGALFLGAGSRIGMRLIAIAQEQPASFSGEGTLTVILLGGGTGAIVSLIFLASRSLFPHHRIARFSFFWIPVGALVLRGLNPVTALNFTVFAPLFLLHGSFLTFYWCRLKRPHTSEPAAAGEKAVGKIRVI